MPPDSCFRMWARRLPLGAPFHTGSVATFASGQPVALFGEGLDYSGRVKQPFIVHFNQSNR